MKVLHLPKLPDGRIDYYALQAYHAAASHDSRRDAKIRSWHALQAAVISHKLRSWDWQVFCRHFGRPLFNLRKK
jgi:hypothetical protein